MTTRTQPFDLSAHLQTDENIREFLDIMLEENGAEGFEQALDHEH
jgi:DNA-binding phage protein